MRRQTAPAEGTLRNRHGTVERDGRRGWLWWLSTGFLAGVLFSVVRRPTAACGCGCIVIVLFFALGGGVIYAYPGPTIVVIAVAGVLVWWLAQRRGNADRRDQP